MTVRLARTILLLAASIAVALAGCGYHVAGRTNALPKAIHVIAVPTMENKSTTFKIEQRLTAATIHEFLAKTNFKVVSDPNGGDAVLIGKVLSVEVLPLLFEQQPEQPQTPGGPPPPTIAQATAMIVTMKCEVTLTERDNDKVLYHTDNFVFRNEYQLATEQTTAAGATRSAVESFFQESDPAFDRMARDFATTLVAAVTENY
jgi:Lipopolysaccharide-assembly